MSKTIRVEDDTYEQLARLFGKLTAEKGRLATMDEVIRRLLK